MDQIENFAYTYGDQRPVNVSKKNKGRDQNWTDNKQGNWYNRTSLRKDKFKPRPIISAVSLAVNESYCINGGYRAEVWERGTLWRGGGRGLLHDATVLIALTNLSELKRKRVD